MDAPKPSRSMMIGSWLAAIALAAPASYLILRFAAGISVGPMTCVPGAVAAGLVWGLLLWPSWRLGRRGFLAFVLLPGVLHTFLCAAALNLGWGHNARFGPSWTLGCLFELYAALIFLVFAGLLGVWRLTGDKRVVRAAWLRPIVLALGILLAAAAGMGTGFGLIGLSENRARSIMAANEKYLKENGDWAPELSALAPAYILKLPNPPWYLADSACVQYGHLPKSTHYWLNWGSWRICQFYDATTRAVTTDTLRYAPSEYGAVNPSPR